MAQWGQGQPGFQYPMQTGFPAANPQFQQAPQFQQQNPQFQQQVPQFQQQSQFQQPPNLGGGFVPQPTGFPTQRPPQFQQPQQTGFPAGGSGFVQQQATGFPGPTHHQQQPPPVPPVPPVPQIPPQYAQRNNAPSFLNAPPPQPNRLMSNSPGFGGGLAPQPTGFPGGPLVAQPTGFVDPRLRMMTNTFMPMNTSAPYTAGGVPQLAPQQSNLQQSFMQHNEAQQGKATQQVPWALTKSEKKQYNTLFRAWDAQSTGFISGQAALDVFGTSGLPKEELARIWTLADRDDRGKLNIAEFHVAMGLIFRRLNGMPIPDVLPEELVPPSARDLDSSVDLIKDLLKNESRSRSPSGLDAPISRLKNRSFTSSSPSLESGRDATIYKHTDEEPLGGIYKPRSRHVNRDDVRSRREDDSPSADLTEMKRQLENTAKMLDQQSETDASRTAEDEALDREMDDLRYRVRRVQDDLDYVSRGPRTAAKDQERRKLEREMLNLMHERIPEVERKIKARDERKEMEKRQWTRDRDRANDRFGRFDAKEESYSSRRYDDYDRSYSRGYDRDDRSPRHDRYDDRERDREREREREREWERERENDRPRSPPARTRSPPAKPRSPAPPPPAPAAPSPKPGPSPAPNFKNMSTEERSAYMKAEAQRRIQARMAALGVTPTQTTSSLDSGVEDRLQQEKKEAEEKARAAEKQAEERERLRHERLQSEKAARGGTSPAPPAPTPTVTTTAPPPAPTPRVAPTAPKRAPAPPPPIRSSRQTTSARAPPTLKAPAPPVAVPAPRPPLVPAVPTVDPEEEKLRVREEAIRKQREERAARLRQLEEEEKKARLEEESYQAKLQALKVRQTQPPKAPSPPPPAPAVQAPPARVAPFMAPPTAPSEASSPAATPEKSTNPFSRLLKEGGGVTPPAAANGSASTNPWSKPPSISPAPAPARSPSFPPPTKSPAPPTNTAPYQTASSPADDDDWGDIKELEEDDDSEDEYTKSREKRANIAQQLFGSMLPSSRPQSTAPGGRGSTPSSPAPGGSGFGSVPSPPPPPPPPAPPAPSAPAPPPPPPVPAAVAAPATAFGSAGSAGPGDTSALMDSIRGGLRLKPTKTVDKSGPPVSGKVLGDTAPPAHISATARPSSPPSPPAQYTPEPPVAETIQNPKLDHRQSIDWYASRAADIGTPQFEVLPATAEVDEGEDMYFTPSPAPVLDPVVPAIHVDEPPAEASSDPLADIDKAVEHRVRSLYAFEGDGPDDLSFTENVVIIANPSKSGTDWWYGKNVSTGRGGLFPKTYIEIIRPTKAKALFEYVGDNPDELSFNEGEMLSIVDKAEDQWWKAEKDGMVFIVPASYLEVVEVAEQYHRTVESPHMLDIGYLAPIISTGTPSVATSTTSTSSLDSSLNQQSRGPTNVSHHDADSELTTSDPDSDSDSGSDYMSFQESDDDDEESKEEREARERERRMVLEAAGLIVHVDESVKPPAELVRARSLKKTGVAGAKGRTRDVSTGTIGTSEVVGDDGKEDSKKRRPPPAVPNTTSSAYADQDTVASSAESRASARRRNGKRSLSSVHSMKDLPPIPVPNEQGEEDYVAAGSLPSSPAAQDADRSFNPDEHAKRLDDAFERYESFRNANLSGKYGAKRLSVVSTSTDTSSLHPPSSPTTTMTNMSVMTPVTSKESASMSSVGSGHQHISSHLHGFHFGQDTGSAGGAGGSGSRYGHFLQLLNMSRGGSKASDMEKEGGTTSSSGRKLVISGPMAMSGSGSGSGDGEGGLGVLGESRSASPAFGTSWASLVDKTALEGIPVVERKRQEAIFELINTEVAYVRDLQLIVEVFYSSMLSLLSRKEITVVFANIEDILLTNTAFVSSLEERQKECRLYVDKIGDILLNHIPSMGVYMEYCVNQAIATKVLKSLRDTNSVLAAHLQRLRDSESSLRNLDLSSYLLAPMQRITRYPLLIKQILQYTEAGEEQKSIKRAQDMSEKLLDHINETIREQEGREVLKKVSESLWIGQGRLDLTAPTRHMGQRRLLKEGPLIKAKSGRKIYAFLCSDIMVLTDEPMKTLYRMPIALAHAQVKEIQSGRDDINFQISQPYPRGGDSIILKGTSTKDTIVWVRAIQHAARKCRHATDRASGRR